MNADKQPTAKQLRRQAGVAGMSRGVARAAGIAGLAAGTEAVVMNAEQPPLVSIFMGGIAVLGAGVAVAKGIKRNRLQAAARVAQAQETQQKRVSDRLAGIREGIDEERRAGQPETTKRKNVITRMAQWAINPFLADKPAPKPVRSVDALRQQSARPHTPGAPLARAVVDAQRTVEGLRNWEKDIPTQVTPEVHEAPQPAVPAQEEHVIPPATQADPFPLNAVFKK